MVGPSGSPVREANTPRGRALTEQQLQASIGAFGALLPERRPPGDRRRAVGPQARNSAGAVFQPLHEVIATDELEAGFRRLEQAVAADPGARRLPILRPCSCSNGASRSWGLEVVTL
jgi:hypothetical protein